MNKSITCCSISSLRGMKPKAGEAGFLMVRCWTGSKHDSFVWDIIVSQTKESIFMIDQNRYHIQFQGRRTTITVDNIISELLAVKLGVPTAPPDAHSLVREWLENTFHEKLGQNVPGGNRISQYARVYAIEAVADKNLMESVWDCRLDQGYG